MSTKHDCAGLTKHDGYGDAVTSCAEDDEGHFVVDNGEYASQVNFCPYCGARAPVPAQPADKWKPVG